jgi:hypothetical protein
VTANLISFTTSTNITFSTAVLDNFITQYQTQIGLVQNVPQLVTNANL